MPHGVRVRVSPLAIVIAQVAELVDAPDSGSGARKGVKVQILSWAEKKLAVKKNETEDPFLRNP